MKTISICVPCYNEEKNVYNMFAALTEIMKSKKEYDYEIIFADNASSDNTVEEIRKIAAKDPRVKAIINYRNYGPQRSIKNSHYAAKGDAIIEIPCDLQEPPSLIPVFIEEWEKGNLVVWGQKKSSEENKFVYFLRGVYYGIIRSLSSNTVFEHVTGFGLMDRSVVDAIRKTEERDMPIRYIVPDLGYPVTLIPYKQGKRKEGKSSYSIGRYWRYAMSSMIRTSNAPLEIATVLGMITATISLIIGFVYLVYKVTHWNTFAAGIAPLVIAMFFLGAVQLAFIGIIGEYIGAILDKVSKRPMVIEKERINFDDD